MCIQIVLFFIPFNFILCVYVLASLLLFFFSIFIKNYFCSRHSIVYTYTQHTFIHMYVCVCSTRQEPVFKNEFQKQQQQRIPCGKNSTRYFLPAFISYSASKFSFGITFLFFFHIFHAHIHIFISARQMRQKREKNGKKRETTKENFKIKKSTAIDPMPYEKETHLLIYI